MQVNSEKRNFPSYFKKTFAAALGIEILCITSAEIGENLGLFYFGFNLIGISIAIILGFAFAGFTTFVTILGKSHGKHIHGCCSILETDFTPPFLQTLKTTFSDFGKGIKKLSKFHREPNAKHILKESIYILVTAESACIIVAEIVALLLYTHSLILSFPIALLAGTVMIVITTYDKRTRYFVPVLVLILILMPFLMTSSYGTGFHFHTFTALDSTPDPSKQSLFQNATYVQGLNHGSHVHSGSRSGTTSDINSVVIKDIIDINGKPYILDGLLLAGSDNLDIPREFSFKIIDPITGELQKNVTYLLSIKKYGDIQFEETFQRENGNLFVKIIPETPFRFFFEEENKIIRSSQVLPGLDGTLEVVRGPILNSVGVYEISLEILTLESYSNIIIPPFIHTGFVTVSDIQYHNIVNSKFGKQEIIISNYLAKTENLQYIEQQQIKFNLPVDFLNSESKTIPDLRMFMEIPKTFSPFLAKDISVLANGYLIDKQFIQIQDIGDTTKLIQFVVPSQSLIEMTQESGKKNIEFVVTPTN